MKTMIRNTTGLVLILLLMAACAREINETDTQVEQRYLEAYAQINYPGAEKKESGLFFIPLGTAHNDGDAPAVGDALYVRYAVRNLNGTITQSAGDSLLAKQLGTFAYKTYYGPQYFSMAEGASMTGLQEAFSCMKPGDKARILLPSWLSSYTAGGSKNLTSISMYDLELLRVVPDIAAFQTDSLTSFSQKYSGVVDSLDNNWFFKELTPGTGAVPAVGDTVKIRYAGYLLDGFMFDTNIKDTAVYEATKAGAKISSSDTFDELTVIMTSDVSSLDVVPGFGSALQRMNDGAEAVTFFSSDYGYGANGSDPIPPYAMLRFYIKVTIGRVATSE